MTVAKQSKDRVRSTRGARPRGDEKPGQSTVVSGGLDIEKVRSRVTHGLIDCEIRLVSLTGLIPTSECYMRFHGASSVGKVRFDKHEKLAANYYESRGWIVLRLEHFSLQGVARLEEKFPESKRLGDMMRDLLPGDVYSHITRHATTNCKPVALNGVDPRCFPMVFYPPDFLLIDRQKNFKFAEVKGPSDKLSLRQANWFVHSLPSAWKFELLALVQAELPDGEIVLPAQDSREGPAFETEFRGWFDKVDEFNQRRRQIAQGATRRNW